MVSGTDVLIIGDGLIGLSTALELGRAGVRCTVLGAARPGVASAAAAGLLVPSIGDLPPGTREFFFASMEQYPRFVASLQRYDAGLRLIEGLVERNAGHDTLYERDGAIDNVRLLHAVRRAAADCATVTLVADPAASVEHEPLAAVGESGRLYAAERIVLAAGAWAPAIRGLPRPLPVRPLKGQMIALGASPLSQAMMGEDVYLVPRGAETLVGATVEEAGFDLTVTQEAVSTLQAGAARLCPALAGAPLARAWAGVRPASADMLPILGPDPDLPTLIYACGHSKNGILLAPATATAVAAWCRGEPTPARLEEFSIARFSS